ncbi:MAG: hypothetical protein CMQ41_07875 [Gammaproteobacteria bacterium]|nr:hypothetical protein [Gammaproteobacteria bacterium]
MTPLLLCFALMTANNDGAIKLKEKDIHMACAQTSHIVDAAKKENIDPYILTSIIYTESRFGPNAVSSAGACGLTQVIPKYSVGKLTCKQLKNPKTSIYAGAASLNQWIKKRGKKKYKEALACYNAGNKCLKSSHGKRYATIVVNLADKLRKIAATKKEPVRFEYYPLDLIHPLESTHQECYATVKD